MRKKTIMATIITIVFLISLATGMQPVKMAKADSRTIVVPADYPTIQGAINSANNGDTILVSAGRYYEGVLVNKSVAIIGESPATTTVYGVAEGSDLNSNGSPFYISADNVIIANMSIKRGNVYRGAIRAAPTSGLPCKNLVIVNNVISEGYSSDGVAIALENSNNFTINNNTIVQGGGRIDVRSSSNGVFSKNNLTGLHSYTFLVSSSSNVSFLDNSIFQCNSGIQLRDSPNSTIFRNRISSGDGGITLSRCPGSVLTNNEIANCTRARGISISESCCCLLRNNTITDSGSHSWGGSSFGVSGYAFNDFALDIDTSNTVDGKPIYYLIGLHDVTLNPSTYPNAGYLALINSTRVNVEGFSMGNCSQGILLALTTNSQIKNNNISNTDDGISLAYYSSGNLIYGNNFQANSQSIRTYYSSNNTIINNNMTSSGVVWIDTSSNCTIFGNNMTGFKLVSANNITSYHNNFGTYVWGYSANSGYPAGGSYYSAYKGVDLKSGISQGIPGPDGIGDTAFYSEYYPLMAPVQLFDAGILGGRTVYLELESNSTLSNIQIDNNGRTVSFSASGITESVGFCRVTIPKLISQDVWNGNYQIVVNGKSSLYTTFADSQNDYAYINYPNQIAQPVSSPTPTLSPTQSPSPPPSPSASISPTPSASPVTSPSIPEFPSLIVLPLLLTAALIIILTKKRAGWQR
jgi:parallel beta-helix repeat protein